MKAAGTIAGNDLTPVFTKLMNSKAVEAVSASLLQQWKAYVEKQVGTHDMAAMASWEHIKDFRDAARQIRNTAQKLDSIRATPPKSRATFDDLTKLVAELESAWKTIENTPKKVLDFLRAAASVGATFSALDDEVIAWLRKMQVEQSFIIRTVPVITRYGN
jgi:hypothetical protein